MTGTGRIARMHRGQRAALAAVLALVIAVASVWIIGDRAPAGSGPRGVAAPTGPSSSPAGSSTTPPSSSGSTSSSESASNTVPAQGKPAVLPVGLQLRAGSAQQPPQPVDVVDGKPLDKAQINAVISRLPQQGNAAGGGEPFRWPTQTIVAPQAGTTVPVTFPATGATTPPAKSTPATLSVLRVQPQGPVSIAPFVSITFNQPMVPLTTVGQQAATRIPATISPAIAGSWQWIGTDTLRFAAKSDQVDRLPMATAFTVTVPAGTRTATGGTLARAATFTFTTPPPTVKQFEPTGKSMQRDPLFLAVFDQQVDPAAVLRVVTATAGSSSVPIRLATAAEIAADTDVSATVAKAPVGRAMVFRPVQSLPVDQAVTVTFGAGLPSTEGPRRTTKPASFTGHTYAALGIDRVLCNGGGPCQPSAELSISFTNDLDAASFDPSAVRIQPDIPGGATVTASGNTMFVEGATQADTDYTVTIPAGLKDVFGQQLGAAQTRKVHIGPAQPRMDPFPSPVTTLDPMVDRPTVAVSTVGRREFRERVFAVSPTDWPTFQRFYQQMMQTNYDKGTVLDVPNWRLLTNRVVPVTGPSSRLLSTSLDLSSELPGPGAVVVIVEPTDRESLTGDDVWQNRPTATWAQSTTIGLDAFNDATQLRSWVTDLRSGSPLSGVTVGLLGGDGKVDPDAAGVSDADGVVSTELTAGGGGALLATRGSESALLPSAMWSNSWIRSTSKDPLLWFVNDDRHTYRPGETVSVKGWVRRQGSDVETGLTALPPGSTVAYSARDAYGIVLSHGVSKLSTLGGFNLSVKIPGGANLGAASIDFSVSGVAGVTTDGYGHPFEIADFRTPDFTVATHGTGIAPYVLGDGVTVAADASYYAGGPLAAAPVQWQVRTAAATYAPPGWDAFNFGIWTPWWEDSRAIPGSSSAGAPRSGPAGAIDQPTGSGPAADDSASVQQFSGTTDAGGSHYLQVKVGDLGKKFAGLPVTLTSQATVTDVNRQAIAGTADLLVHPASFYVGLASDDTFVAQGKDLAVQAIATDIDGAAAPDRSISITAAKVTTSWVNGAAVDAASNAQTCARTSGTAPVICTFRPAAAGTYKITATVTDDKGRTSRSELTRWVAGLDGSLDTSVQQQLVTLVPDKKQYQPGSSAKVLVQSPIRTGSGLLTVLHNGIVSTIRFAVADGSAVVSVPITTAELPGVTVSVEVVGTAPRTADAGGSGTARPAYATGQIGLSVSTQVRTLKVTAVPRQRTVAPGGSTSVDVTVTDQQGHPMPHSEFELVVADEAVLALGGDELPDPMESFYPDLPDQLVTAFGRSTVMLADQPPPPPGQQGGAPASSAASSAPAGAAAPAGAGGAYSTETASAASTADTRSVAGPAIADRQNFDPLAVFVPSATTDGAGRATIAVPLPDNLTRYRVMVVAVAGASQFGSAEATITAALPLTVRPSAPRFLNFGDTMTLPVVLQNQTDAPLTTDVVVQGTNLAVAGPAGREVTVPARDRIEVPFALSAVRAGTAMVRVAAVSGANADAATVQFPVYTPTTTESAAAYGILNGGETVRQLVSAPKGVVEQFGGLQISTSSTALQQLTDAVDYLADYQYDSSDALAAQIIAIGSLGDVLAAFDAPGLPSAASLKALVAADVTKLMALQNGDGGFPYWRQGDPSDPFNSIQATQALLVAAERGFVVSADNLSRAKQFLAQIGSVLPSTLDQTTRDTLQAYALNVRMQGGQRDPAAAEKLVGQRGESLSLDAVAWLLPVLTDQNTQSALERRISNAAVADAGSVTFTNRVTDDAWTTLQSDRRTDGLILDALIAVQPKSDLIPKIVAGLMAGQTDGRWNNVQENAVILLALRHYYDAFEKTTPAFLAQVWLGGRFAGQHAFDGHTTERATVTLPTAQLLAAGNSDVTLHNDGTGRLFYRLALQTAPVDLTLAPLDRGFVVARTYQAVDHPGDVTRDGSGIWHIKAGARVRVHLELVSRSARTHVALTDPLPAGLQILNPELATTPRDLGPTKNPADVAKGLADDSASPSWYTTWYDHQNLRDDRAEAFATQLQGGVYQYSYLASATTSGTFVTPPARAEQVYAPETFGRGATDRVVIGG